MVVASGLALRASSVKDAYVSSFPPLNVLKCTSESMCAGEGGCNVVRMLAGGDVILGCSRHGGVA